MSIKMARFEWLLPNQHQTDPANDPTDADILPPCPGGQMHMEQVSVLGEAMLYIVKARFNEAMNLAADDGQSGNHLGLILTQTGQYQLQAEGDPPATVDPAAVILHLPEERGMSYHFPQGERVEAAALTLGRPALQALLESERPPALLRDWIEDRAGTAPFMNRLMSSPVFARAAQQLVDNPYQGAARRLFFEAKILEGFAELLHRLDNTQTQTSTPTPWERARVYEARDLLANQVADPPSLTELARLVGLPVKRLDRLFREVFGVTPFAWVRDYRLNLAKQLLTEEALPIKHVAYRLGYANVHNFTHAFTARFGITPGAVRGRGKKIR